MAKSGEEIKGLGVATYHSDGDFTTIKNDAEGNFGYSVARVNNTKVM